MAVDARANAAGFGPLVARVPHPLGRIYATITWGYFLIPVVSLLGGLVVFATGPSPWHGLGEWAIGLLGTAFAVGLALLLATRARGHVRRQAFYLYPQGYLLTSPFGRVVRVVPWTDVTTVDILPVTVSATVAVWSTAERVICEIKHVRGRKIRFTEVLGRESLGPLAQRLHAAATEGVDHDPPTLT